MNNLQWRRQYSLAAPKQTLRKNIPQIKRHDESDEQTPASTNKLRTQRRIQRPMPGFAGEVGHRKGTTARKHTQRQFSLWHTVTDRKICDTHTHTHTEWEWDRQRDRERERDRQTERRRQTDGDRQTETDRNRETDYWYMSILTVNGRGVKDWCQQIVWMSSPLLQVTAYVLSQNSSVPLNILCKPILCIWNKNGTFPPDTIPLLTNNNSIRTLCCCF